LVSGLNGHLTAGGVGFDLSCLCFVLLDRRHGRTFVFPLISCAYALPLSRSWLEGIGFLSRHVLLSHKGAFCCKNMKKVIEKQYVAKILIKPQAFGDQAG